MGTTKASGPSSSRVKQNGVDQLSADGFRRLIRSLGVSITPGNRGKLDDKMQSLDDQGRRDGALLDFIAFLRMMRWMLDTDFAGAAAAGGRFIAGKCRMLRSCSGPQRTPL